MFLFSYNCKSNITEHTVTKGQSILGAQEGDIFTVLHNSDTKIYPLYKAVFTHTQDTIYNTKCLMAFVRTIS